MFFNVCTHCATERTHLRASFLGLRQIMLSIFRTGRAFRQWVSIQAIALPSTPVVREPRIDLDQCGIGRIMRCWL